MRVFRDGYWRQWKCKKLVFSFSVRFQFSFFFDFLLLWNYSSISPQWSTFNEHYLLFSSDAQRLFFVSLSVRKPPIPKTVDFCMSYAHLYEVAAHLSMFLQLLSMISNDYFWKMVIGHQKRRNVKQLFFLSSNSGFKHFSLVFLSVHWTHFNVTERYWQTVF